MTLLLIEENDNCVICLGALAKQPGSFSDFQFIKITNYFNSTTGLEPAAKPFLCCIEKHLFFPPLKFEFLIKGHNIEATLIFKVCNITLIFLFKLIFVF